MAKRRVQFACAILAGIIGSTLLTLLPRVSVIAAEDCLSQPTGEKLDGQQWRYRLDRSSNRRCWYLKDTAANTRDSARDAGPRQASQPTSAWDFAQPAPPKLAPRRADRAESPSRVRVDDDAKPAAPPSLVRTQPAASFDDNLQRSAAAASWQPLDSVDMDSTASGAATSASSPADQPAAATDATASPAATEPLAAAPAKPARPTAPIHKLLLVVVGALSLSGLLASALYRLSKMGRRRRRNRNWQRAIARARRHRDKPRSKSKTVYAGSRITARPTIVEAPVAASVRAAPPPAAIEMPPPVVAVAPVQAVDPAAELVDLLASRAAKAAPVVKPAPAVEPEPQPAASSKVEPDDTARAIEPPAPAPIPDPAAELVDLLGSHAAKKAVKKLPRTSRPAAKAKPPAPPATVEAAPPRLPLVADPAAELANLLESRFVPPPAPQVRQAAARAKPQAPVAPAEPPAKKVVDPITELTNLLEAKEYMRVARRAKPAAPDRGPAPVIPAKPPATPVADPAAELFDMLEARARRSPQPVQAPPPIQTAQPVQTPESLQAARPVRPTQPAAASPRIVDAQPGEPRQARRPEPVAASHAGKPASQPKAAAPRRKKAPAAARAEMEVMPIKAAAPAKPSERAAAPKPGKQAGKAPPRGSRRKDADQRPLPPALMLEPENDGPTPPLDFIPRPQALRPRLRDIRHDESLDGVQDILARLAKRG